MKYPFSQNKKDYPDNSIFIKENYIEEYWMIEYDVEQIQKILENKNPAECFSDFPKINKKQLIELISLITRNIVEINNKKYMKQSAVEWLQEQYYDSEGKLTKHDFEQAKEMFEKQMNDAYKSGFTNGNNLNTTTFSEWFEQFKKK